MRKSEHDWSGSAPPVGTDLMAVGTDLMAVGTDLMAVGTDLMVRAMAPEKAQEPGAPPPGTPANER
jgi:hypothetical protein